jgi:hypothetical protein
MKTSILLRTTKGLSLLILLTGLLAFVSAGTAMADPPTPVTCGSVITAPGQYVLAGDCTGPGITIAASDVHLKLDGHTMTSQFIGETGISANFVSGLHIEGPGTITLFSRCIGFGAVSDSHIEQVTCVNNQVGLDLGSGTTNTHVNNNFSSMNSYGILCEFNTSDNHLNNNQTLNNQFGIWLQTGATSYHVNGNTALGNLLFDLQDDNVNCDDNQWNGNTFTTANQPCID